MPRRATTMRIRTKRTYEEAAAADGIRYLVDRLWPRGLKKADLLLDAWLKEVAPSDTLRRWYGHDPGKWDEFRQRYFKELDANPSAWKPLLDTAKHEPVTLVYGAKDTEHNQAVALQQYLEGKKHD